MMYGRLTKTMKIFFFSINSILNVHCKSKVLVMQTTPTGIFLTNRFSSNPGHLSKAARASQFIYT